MSNIAQSPFDPRRLAVVLNGCIEVCIDGQKTYAIGAANVRNPALKEMLQRHSDQRADFVLRLQAALEKLGATPENEGTLHAAVQGQWHEARRALEPTHSDLSVLRQCVRDEEAALERYAVATTTNAVSTPMDIRVLLDEQLASIESALAAIRQRLTLH
jgi:uncharacterized protein (TIGR02284 family)